MDHAESSARQATRSATPYLLPLIVFIFISLYSSFFLQGLRLYDNDYNQWIANARTDTLFSVLSQVFDPVLDDWNVDFRPTQTLIFKGLFSFFEYDAAGYFYFKSVALAVLITVYFLFLRRYLNTTIALLSSLFVGTAGSTFTSYMWVSDFVLVSELLALFVYWIFLNLEMTQEHRNSRIWLFSILMVVLTLICDRTKANGKLIPAILLSFILLSGYRKLTTYGPAIAAMVAVIVPWKVVFESPAPFLFAKPETVAINAWQPASISRFWTDFGRDFEPFSLLYPLHPPGSILAIIGFPLVYSFVLGIAFLLWRHFATGPPSKKEGKRSKAREMDTPIKPASDSINGPRVQLAVLFLIVWAAINAAAMMSYPPQAEHFQGRYAISTLIPLVPLVLLGIANGARLAFKNERVGSVLVCSLVIVQLAFSGYHTIRARNDFPSFMIASDMVREYIAQNFRGTWFFYINSPLMSYRPTTDENQFFSTLNEDINSVARRLPPNVPLYLLALETVQSPDLPEPPVIFPGKADSLYDRIFNSGTNPSYRFTFYLYRVRI